MDSNIPVKLSEVMVACMRVPSIQTKTAPPMRLSEVQANTTWESLQTAGADCCVPLGLVSNLIRCIECLPADVKRFASFLHKSLNPMNVLHGWRRKSGTPCKVGLVW
ncbi:hypothetical protein ACROYT_G043067 [Oculina patagonica]